MLRIFNFFNVNAGGSGSFLVIFLLFKSLTFITPLLLINALLIDEFVQLESGLALSNILVIFINFGVSSAIPLYLLKEKREAELCYIYYHSIFFSALMIVIAIAFNYYLSNDKWSFICIVISILCNVRVLSSHNKSRSKPTIAVFFESYIYMVLFFSLVFYYLFKELSLSSINFYLLLSSIIILLLSIFELYKLKPRLDQVSFSNFKSLYSFSGISLFVSISVVSIITLIRAFGSDILTAEQFILYSVYFRFFSISIIIFQFYSTLKFKSLYHSSHQYLDVVFSKVALSILLFVLMLLFLSDYIIPFMFNEENKSILASDWSLTLPILLVMPLWVVSTLLSNIVSRERTFLSMLISLVTFSMILSLITACLYYYDILDFGRILYIHVIFVALLSLSQLFSLSKLGFVFKRVRVFVFSNLFLGLLGVSLSF
ncbi:MAG TPA: hypothetical protein DEV59_11730 [Proteus sp.]|nr:hypothetical protein [Proteus sp. (in: enterobacteria)]